MCKNLDTVELGDVARKELEDILDRNDQFLSDRNRRVKITYKPYGMGHGSPSASASIAVQTMRQACRTTAFNLSIIDKDENSEDQILFEATLTEPCLIEFIRNDLENQLLSDPVSK